MWPCVSRVGWYYCEAVITNKEKNFNDGIPLIYYQYHTNDKAYTQNPIRFLDIWQNFYDMLAILVLQHCYNQLNEYCEIYNNYDTVVWK